MFCVWICAYSWVLSTYRPFHNRQAFFLFYILNILCNFEFHPQSHHHCKLQRVFALMVSLSSTCKCVKLLREEEEYGKKCSVAKNNDLEKIFLQYIYNTQTHSVIWCLYLPFVLLLLHFALCVAGVRHTIHVWVRVLRSHSRSRSLAI